MKVQPVKRALAATLCTVAALFPLAGAQAAQRSAASATIPLLRVGDTEGYSTLNPNQTQGCATDICALTMQRLMSFNPAGTTVHPQLAASVDQPNSVTYVYHLRRSVKFWDGDPMTSADVVASLDYQRAPASETAVYYTNVKSIAATGPYTVVITLKHPNAAWNYVMAFEGVVFEKKFMEEHKATLGNPGVGLMGTGPWELDSFDPTSGAQLSVNPYWWGNKVQVQHISFTFFSSETSEALAMRAGEIDLAYPSSGQSFASTSGAKVMNITSLGQDLLAMNVKLKPWSDIHLRRAVAYAINRPALITASGGPGSGEPLYTIIPPPELRTLASQSQVNALLASLPHYTYDLAEAKQQISESAYPKGFSASIDTSSCCGFPDVLQVIAAQLEKIGITLKVTEVTTEKFVTVLYGPKTYGLTFSNLYAAYPDPSEQSGYLLGAGNAKQGGINWADYTPPSVDQLLARGIATDNPATRFSIYSQLLRKLATDLPYVPLFNFDSYIAVSNKFNIQPFSALTYQIPWAMLVTPKA